MKKGNSIVIIFAFVELVCVNGIAFCSESTDVQEQNLEDINSMISSGCQDDDDDLYVKIFGVRKHKNIMMDFPVFLDGEKIGEVLVLVQSKSKKIYANKLKEILKDFLLDEEVAKLDKLIDEDGFIDLDKLSFLRLNAKMDMIKLALNITVPWNIKKERSLGSRYRYQKKKINVKPAVVSGFVNARFSHEIFSYGGYSQHLLLSPTLNVAGLVLESEVSCSKSSIRSFDMDGKDNKFKFRREYTALVYDMPEKDLRFYLGDIYSSVVDYQEVPKLLGVGIKKFCHRYGENFQNKRVPLVLVRKSTIEVYINGTKVKEERDVPPGSYTLDDIPFGYGSNDIDIKITDDTGRIKHLDSSYFNDTSVLQFGEIEFGAFWGYPEINQKMRYDKNNPLINGYFKVGVADATELTLGIETNKKSNLISYGVKNASIIGTVDISAAISKHTKNNVNFKGNAAKIYYSTPVVYCGKVGIYAGVSAERTKDFVRPYLFYGRNSENIFDYDDDNYDTIYGGILQKDENLKGKTSRMNYHVSFSDIAGCNLNMNYDLYRQENSQKFKSMSLNVFKNVQFDNDMISNGYINFSAGKSYGDSGSKASKSLSLSISLSLKEDHYVSVGYYNNNNTNFGSFSISHNTSDDGVQYNASFDGCKNYKTLGLFAGYNHASFKADVHHYRRYGSSYDSNSTQLGFETTIFFADGSLAIARDKMYEGSFVIAKPVKALAGKSIKFVGNHSTSGDFFGAVTTISNNGINSSRIDLSCIPDGMVVENDVLVSSGAYKRGAVVEICSEGNYMVEGFLKDYCGKPLSLISGYAVNLDDKSMAPEQFFTNSKGKFIISNLKVGRYKAVFNIECCDNYLFEIKDADQQLVKIGEIKCGNCAEDEEVEHV